MRLRKRVVTVFLALGVVAGLAGPAAASHSGGRADGVCGGVGYHYDPVLGECVPD